MDNVKHIHSSYRINFPWLIQSYCIDKSLQAFHEFKHTKNIIFRHKWTYPGIPQAYSTLCNPGMLKTLVYLEPGYIPNPVKHVQLSVLQK